MNASLSKYHGLGNDYLVYDPNINKMELTESAIKLICDRNFGVGSDGILYGPIITGNYIGLRIYNPDGSEAEKSGNGLRIFAKYLYDMKYVKEEKYQINTLGGIVDIEYMDESGNIIKVAMGKVSFKSNDIPVVGIEREVINEEMSFNGDNYKVTCLSIGNPHCVIMMNEVSKDLACELGPYVEKSINFPKRINMQLLKVIDRGNIQIEIYERGAGYTLASGSSSCAAASVAHKLGLVDDDITVHMPGGILYISIKNDIVYMTGSVNSIGNTILSGEFMKELNNSNVKTIGRK